MNSFDRPKTVLTIAGVLALVIVLLLVISRLTSPQLTDTSAGASGDGHCAVARRAVEAFDQGRPPPVEWIQDRAAAETAVKNCDEK